MADAGFGVEAAARQFALDFVPVASERYLLLTGRQTLAYPSVQELLRLLRGPEFAELTRLLPGYRADRAGEILELTEAFPWLTEGSAPRPGARGREGPAKNRRAR
jgi:molybdate-binding protein